MSFLNLKKLLPHKKVWKLLTNKLHFKLIRSKPSKKSKHRSFKTSKRVCWPYLSIQPKKFKKQQITPHKNNHLYLKRRPPPIFIDQLYVEPVSIVKEHVVSPKGASKGRLDSSAKLKKSENFHHIKGQPTSSNNGNSRPESNNGETSMVSPDDAWESMTMASPQMHEINERAEEFIARFRAQMHQQEVLARRL